MPSSLLLAEPGAAGDLDTYLGRAAAVNDGSARLIVERGALAVYVPVVFPTSLLDDAATVLGLRVFGLTGEPEGLDAIVPIASLRGRVQAAEGGIEIGMPAPVYSVTWAGIAPPQGGWQRLDATVSTALLERVATEGIAEVAAALPSSPGEAVVRQVRAAVWGEAIEGAEALPRGVAFGAYALGFLPPPGEPAEEAALFELGPWSRVTLRRGHVLVKRRGAWSLAR